MGFLIVNTVKEFPRSGVTTGFLLNTSWIRHAKQEYRSDGPIGVIDEEFRILTEAEATEYYYATPVVHIWLKHDLRVFPTVSAGAFVNEDKFPQVPNDRPTEIWIDGILSDFLALISTGEVSAEEAAGFFTIELSNDSIVITEVDGVKRLAVLCSAGAVTVTGTESFQGNPSGPTTLEAGQSNAWAGNPIKGVTITSSTSADIAQVHLTFS